MIFSINLVLKPKFDKINIVTCVLTALVLAGRLLSGAHWLSDIFGGVLISCTLLAYFKLIYGYKKERE